VERELTEANNGMKAANDAEETKDVAKDQTENALSEEDHTHLDVARQKKYPYRHRPKRKQAMFHCKVCKSSNLVADPYQHFKCTGHEEAAAAVSEEAAVIGVRSFFVKCAGENKCYRCDFLLIKEATKLWNNIQTKHLEEMQS